MKNDLFKRAAAQLEMIESKFKALFAECENETKGMPTAESNKIFNTKYKAQYDELDRLLDIVSRVYWYTDQQNSRKCRQINHRLVVARMRNAGLHRMAL